MMHATPALADDTAAVLRVCADANNMPLSNDRGEGYENRIASELAHDFGWRLQYTFFPQRMGFVRHTLKERDPQTRQWKCDVIIGVPAGKIDLAIVWGPIAGLLVTQHGQSRAWRAVPFKRDAAIKFDYEMAMGVRFGEPQWQRRLDGWIAANGARIEAILARYRVPLMDADGKLISDLADL